MKKLIAIAMLISACGQKSNTPSALIAAKPSQQTFQVTLNTGTNYAAPQPVSIALPSPSDFQVLSNQSNWYHVSFSLGSVTCDFIHNINSNSLVNGGGCTTSNTTVNLATGEVASLSGPATVQVTLNGRTL